MSEMKALQSKLKDQQRIVKVREDRMNEFRGAQRLIRLTTLFEVLDQEGKGFLNAEDLFLIGKAMSEIGDQQVEWTPQRNASMFNEMDADGDGRVVKDEFVSYFINISSKSNDDSFEKSVGRFHTAAQNIRHNRLSEANKKIEEVERRARIQVKENLEAAETKFAQIQVEASRKLEDSQQKLMELQLRELDDSQQDMRLQVLFEMLDQEARGFLDEKDWKEIVRVMGPQDLESRKVTEIPQDTEKSWYSDRSYASTLPNSPHREPWDGDHDMIHDYDSVPRHIQKQGKWEATSELQAIMAEINTDLYGPEEGLLDEDLTIDDTPETTEVIEVIKPYELFTRMTDVHGRIDKLAFIEQCRNITMKGSVEAYEKAGFDLPARRREAEARKAGVEEFEKSITQAAQEIKQNRKLGAEKKIEKSEEARMAAALKVLQGILRRVSEKRYGRAVQAMKQGWMRSYREEQRLSRLHSLFDALDQEGQGFLIESDFYGVGQGLVESVTPKSRENLDWTTKRNAQLFAEMNSRGDGKVSKKEFMAFWKKTSSTSNDAAFEKGIQKFQAAAQQSKVRRNEQQKQEIREQNDKLEEVEKMMEEKIIEVEQAADHAARQHQEESERRVRREVEKVTMETERKSRQEVERVTMETQRKARQDVERVTKEAERTAQRITKDAERSALMSNVTAEKARKAYVRSCLKVLGASLQRQSHRKYGQVFQALKQSYFNFYKSSQRLTRLSALFDVLDQDGNGYLNEQEFFAIGRAMGEQQLEWTPERNAELFYAMDTRHSGLVGKQEFVTYWKNMSRKAGAVAFEKGVKRFHTAAQNIRHQNIRQQKNVAGSFNVDQARSVAVRLIQILLRRVYERQCARALYAIAQGHLATKLKQQALEHHKRLVALLQEHRGL